MILTSLIGMLLATEQMVSLDVLILGNLGIALRGLGSSKPYCRSPDR